MGLKFTKYFKEGTFDSIEDLYKAKGNTLSMIFAGKSETDLVDISLLPNLNKITKNMKNATSIFENAYVKGIDTLTFENLKIMDYMFKSANIRQTGIDWGKVIPSIDNVTSIHSAFSTPGDSDTSLNTFTYDALFKKIPENWNFKNVKDCNYAFDGNKCITEIPMMNLENAWRAIYMFSNCDNLEKVNISFGRHIYTERMFNSCKSLKELNIHINNSDNTYNYADIFSDYFVSFHRYATDHELKINVTSSNIDYILSSYKYQFGYNLYLKELIIDVPLRFSGSTGGNEAFTDDKALVTISTIDLRDPTLTAYNMFTRCTNLTNLDIININSKSLQIGSGTAWGHLLTVDSLVNCCKECIKGDSSRTLTIGSANIEKLASVYVKLTDEAEEDETLPKLPMIQCESTDEGAMLISDYMTLKNWLLA